MSTPFRKNDKKAPDFQSFLLINSPNLLNALDKAVERRLSRALLPGEAGRPALVSDDRLLDLFELASTVPELGRVARVHELTRQDRRAGLCGLFSALRQSMYKQSARTNRSVAFFSQMRKNLQFLFSA